MSHCVTISAARPWLFVTLVFCLCAAPAALRAQDDLTTYPIRFAILGDRTGDHQPGIYQQVVAEIERLRPELVITVGDMIEGYTTDSTEIDAEWLEYFEEVKPLTAPLHCTPGNHDITFDQMQPAYERFVGPPFTSFDHRGMHVVILDNSRWGVIEEFPGEQIAWLASDLRQHAGAKATCVFFHQPYWYRTLADGKPDTLHSLFKTYGVDAVFCGHFHQYFSGEFDGIKYTCVGSSGGDTEPGPTGLHYHFAWVTVNDDGFHIAPVKMGAVLPWEEQSVTEVRTINAIASRDLVFAQPAVVSEALAIESGAASLRITNGVREAYGDTVRWEIPEGWSVEPAVCPFALPAGGSTALDFRVTCAGDLYPVPEFRLRLPYAEGRTAAFNGRLEIVRPLACARARRAPVIDGELTDAVWRGPAQAMLDPAGKPSELDPVAVFFAYDRDDFYLGVRCAESRMDSLAAVQTERDAPVYGEDCFGIMISPDAGGGVGYQIYVNPLGTVYDQILEEQTDGYWTGNGTWNGEYQIRTNRGEDYWTIEARVPLAQFGIQANQGDTWRVNFRRKQYRTGSFSVWQLPWSYDPVCFGSLVMQ